MQVNNIISVWLKNLKQQLCCTIHIIFKGLMFIIYSCICIVTWKGDDQYNIQEDCPSWSPQHHCLQTLSQRIYKDYSQWSSLGFRIICWFLLGFATIIFNCYVKKYFELFLNSLDSKKKIIKCTLKSDVLPLSQQVYHYLFLQVQGWLYLW